MPVSEDVSSVLEELNYPALKNIKLDSLSLTDFSHIVHWISKQLRFFAKIDSIVHPIKDNADLVSLNVELNSLFKEVDSIYSDSLSLQTVQERLAILHSLCGDLLAARLFYIKKQNEDDFSTNLNPRKDLSTINTCLALPNDIKDTKLYFQKIKEKLDKNLLKFQQEDSLLLSDNKTLNAQQWAELKRLNDAFHQEYSIRREMLIRRADTTVNSFSWKNDDPRDVDKNLISKVHSSCRKKISVAPCITLANALAARSSDCNALINDVISTTHVSCLIEVPSMVKANQGAQQRLQLHKYLIGAVPDRGGRPGEQPMPSRETFTQQQGQRENASNRRGRGGGGGGGFGGGGGRGGGQRDNYQTNRVQNAGWQQRGGGGGGQYNNYQQGGRGQNYNQDNYEQYQGGHDRFTGGYNQSQGRGGGRGQGGNRNNRYG